MNNFCYRVDGQKVNKKVLESLIKIGAFDQFGKRNAMLSAIDEIKTTCDKAKKSILEGQFSLFASESTSNDYDIKDNFPEIDEFDDNQKLEFEKELLGVYVSQKPISKLLAKYTGKFSIDIKTILDTKPTTIIKFPAVIAKIKTIFTKKDNQPMAFCTLQDTSAKIEAILFPKTYIQYQTNIKEGDMYIFSGKLSFRDDSISLIIDTLESDFSPINEYDFLIKIPQNTSQDQLVRLNALLKSNPNTQKGAIQMPNGKIIKLNFGVKYTDELQYQIDKILQIDKFSKIT